MSAWDVKTLKFQFYTTSQGGQINSMAFSPDGRILAVAGLDKTVSLFDASRGKLLGRLTGHPTNINSLKFSPDGKFLASASSDGTVRLWDPAKGKELRRLQVNGGPDGIAHRRGGVRTVRFTSDGKWLVTAGEDRALNLWEASTGKHISEYYGLDAGVLIVEVSPDGKRLAVVGVRDDQTVLLLDIDQMKRLASLTAQIQPVKSVAFSPDGNTLAIAGDGTKIKLWTRELRRSDAK